MITRLAFYDFDSTLFSTPMPDEGKLRWKQVTGEDYPHEGWWTKEESLDTKVFDIKPFPTVVSRLKNDTARSDTFTVLLTNRDIKLRPMIMQILRANNLKFDDYSLFDGSYGGNNEKDDRIDRFIKKHPDAKEIDIYDDREKELLILNRFKRMVRDDGITINIYKADKGNLSLVESYNHIKNIINEEINKFFKNYH